LSFIPLLVQSFSSLAEKKGYYHLFNYFKVLSMTAIELITKEDLKQFKSELLAEIKQIIKPGAGESKQWLKSVEVRKMLSISPGTLQTLRINGTLRFTKVGGMMYYKLEDIHKVLEGK
jgi:ribonucleotide reductase beta subunit family protein with ferritin-like domain